MSLQTATRVPSFERTSRIRKNFTKVSLKEEFQKIAAPSIRKHIHLHYAFLRGPDGGWIRNTSPFYFFQISSCYNDVLLESVDNFYQRVYEDICSGNVSLFISGEFIEIFHSLIHYFLYSLQDEKLENIGSVFLEKGCSDDLLFEAICVVSYLSGKKRMEHYYSSIIKKNPNHTILSKIKQKHFPEVSGITEFPDRLSVRLASGQLFRALRLVNRSEFMSKKDRTLFFLETYFNSERYIPFLLRYKKAKEFLSQRNILQLVFVLRKLSLKNEEEKILGEYFAKPGSRINQEELKIFTQGLSSRDSLNKKLHHLSPYAKLLLELYHGEKESEQSEKCSRNELFVSQIEFEAGVDYSEEFLACIASCAGRNLNARSFMAKYFDSAGNSQRAYALYNSLSQKNAYNLYRTAVNAVHTGRTSRAALLFEKLLDENPGSGRIWFAYGVVLERLGRQSESMQAYGNAQELEPDLDLVSENSGQLEV